MKVEYKLFLYLGTFYLLCAVIYSLWTKWEEPVGSTALFLTVGLCAMISGFIWWTGRKLPGLRPDDDEEGEIAQQEGDYGFFAPHSWWPLFLAGACALLFLGAAIGWWLVILAAPFLAVATVGWTFEFFRGEHAV